MKNSKKIFSLFKFAGFLAIFALKGVLLALDLGSYGHTFPILEKNMIDLLQERLGQLSKDQLEIHATIDFDKLSSQRLTKTVFKKVFYYDPTITVSEEIRDPQGNIVVEKGTRKNPLDFVPLGERLAFFDSKDPEQVEWALKLENAKLILVSGNLFELEDECGRPIYFDQKGYITEKLGISHTPALVSQEGSLLRIEEIVLQGETP